ncbi:MAG: hypothetical protein K2X27_03470 [Candidatus Obscuribacterales bacterium]|nr:hypothetical protein [Candidatus Obscuribacterales bacterium]
MADATPVLNVKREYPDGAILQIVIWQLPQPTTERPHGYKYRLNYSLADGSTLVRYDNERGKGDHKHIREVQHPYKFTSIRQLLADFNADVLDNGGSL